MTEQTLLLRQIHPTFIQEGRVTSQAFRPTPKDESQLSVDHGDMISAEASLLRYVSDPKNSSAGVMAVTPGESCEHNLPVVHDGDPYPEHCYLNFSAFTTKECEKIGKKLAEKARQRGWLYEASTPNG